MQDAPEPIAPADGKQSAGDATALVGGAPAAVLPPADVSEAIVGIAGANARALGGETVARMLAGHAKQTSTALADAQTDVRELRKQLRAADLDLAAERIKSSILEERLRSGDLIKNFQLLGNAIGMAMLGLAIELLRAQFLVAAGVACVLGLALIGLSWYWPLKAPAK